MGFCGNIMYLSIGLIFELFVIFIVIAVCTFEDVNGFPFGTMNERYRIL